MYILRNIIIVIFVVLLSLLSSPLFGDLYKIIFPTTPSGWLDLTDVAVFPIAFIFFTTFLFTIFGSRGKYLWMGALLIPAAVAELYLDIEHIYFPIILGLAGWLIGLGILRAWRLASGRPRT